MSTEPTRRPRVAVLCSVYFAGSHADVILSRLLDGYVFDGEHQQARVEVAAVYLEQLGSSDYEPISRTDVGVATLDAHGIPKRFLDHGSRGHVLDAVDLTPDAVAADVRARLG